MDKELIWKEEDGTLGFGDYTLAEKSKVNDFEFDGDLYKVKTFCEMTKLERNGMFVYESVPGTAVGHFQVSEKAVVFDVASGADAQITLELEPEKEYKIFIVDERIQDADSEIEGIISQNEVLCLGLSVMTGQQICSAIRLAKKFHEKTTIVL